MFYAFLGNLVRENVIVEKGVYLINLIYFTYLIYSFNSIKHMTAIS